MLGLEEAAAEDRTASPLWPASRNSWRPAGVSISKRRHQSNAVYIGGYISMLVDPLSRSS